MNLLNETRSRLRWFLSLARTIGRVTGPQVVGAVATFIFGQISLVLAMLLPLKVILLVASDGVPWYLRRIVSADTKDTVIVALAFSALLAYALHLSTERVIARRLDAGARRILEHSRKSALFRNDRMLVRGHYYRFCRILANAMLFAIAATVGLIVDPPLFIALLSVIAVEYLSLAHILKREAPLGQTLLTALDEGHGRLLTLLTNANFLIGFACLFAQFLGSPERNAVLAIVTFMMLRQTTNRLRNTLADFIALSNDRHRINPLFHANVRYTPPPDTEQEAFFLAMQANQRRIWIPDALASVTGGPVPELVETRWNDTGSLGIAAFDVRVRMPDGTGSRPGDERFDYFLRCFASSHLQDAEHEALLLESSAPSLAPTYLGRTDIADFAVLVFRGLPKGSPPRAAFARTLPELLRQCEQTAIDESVQDNYERTHRNLAQRIDRSLIRRLRAAADSTTARTSVRKLEEHLPRILEALRALPSTLINPELSSSYARSGKDGRILVWSWHKWRIDLLDARSLRDTDGKSLLGRPVGKLDPEHLRNPNGARLLASHLDALESALRRGSLELGLRHASNIIQLWERIQQETKPD